ncbi:MAG: hypothetical protein A2017_20100 [Lentisphaerae bacterium GWF2_44_16]|nr:MAG: hypothetical protein A2017_20100 [Lentisphaerae bacterium GWF2_44_16]
MLKKEWKKLLAGICFLGGLLFADASDFTPDRTLYVSGNGSDANDGISEKTALKTIGRAAELAKPGDLVIVKGGKYREQVTLEKSGTPEKPIVFRAAPDETVLMTWGWDIEGWKKLKGTRFVYESSFPYAINMLWEKRTLSRYLELESMELLEKQPGGFVFDKKTGKIFIHAFDGGNPASAGIVAVPYKKRDVKDPSPVPFSVDVEQNNMDSSRLRIFTELSGITVRGDYNILEGFEFAFFPGAALITGITNKAFNTGSVLKKNVAYGCSGGFRIRHACDAAIENNRAYKADGSGIHIGGGAGSDVKGKNKNILVSGNYLLNNGPCAPFDVQRRVTSGHPFSLAVYGRSEDVRFIGNTVISDDPSRLYGTMRCKSGVLGNMDVCGNVFVGGGPVFYASSGTALIQNNTVIGGNIRYDKTLADGSEYKPELKDNLYLNGNKEKPCFADTFFYDYRLRKDSPFIGKGAYPEAGQILYVNVSAKDGGDGSSPGKAFKSLSAALEKAVPGNCIYMLPGTYGENISIAKKKSVTLRNYGKGKVVLENASFVLKDCGKLCVDGMIFRNSKVRLENSDGMEFLHCVFEGEGIAAENCGSLKAVNNTFVKSSLSAPGARLVLRNNLFADCKSLPVQSDLGKTISENNVFSGGNAGTLLKEWKDRYSEGHPSFAEKVKLQDDYLLPDESRLVYSGLGWTFVGALGPEKKKREIMVEELKAMNVLPDRIVLKWYTPFDYPDVRITCKDGKGKNICNIEVRQGEYKQTERTKCLKGFDPETDYEIGFVFTNSGGTERTEKKLKVRTAERKEFTPKTLHVSKSGNDTNDGLSFEKAKKTIGAALFSALPSDTVLVAPGVYTEQNEIFIDGLSKEKPFTLKSEKPGQAVISAGNILENLINIQNCENILIEGFIFTDMYYSSIVSGILIDRSKSVSIKNCLFLKMKNNVSNIYMRALNSSGITVGNCVFYRGFQGIWMRDCDGVEIFNNTFLENAVITLAVESGNNAGIRIYNNIFMQYAVFPKKNPAVYFRKGEKVFCDYNLYWKGDNPNLRIATFGNGLWDISDKDTAGAFEEAQKKYGIEKHGQFADPLLKDPKNGDFRLKSGSPAIGKGKNGSNIGTDMSVFLK